MTPQSWERVSNSHLQDAWLGLVRKKTERFCGFSGVWGAPTAHARTPALAREGKETRGAKCSPCATCCVELSFGTNSPSGHSGRHLTQQTQLSGDRGPGSSAVTGAQQVGPPGHSWEAPCCTAKPDYCICEHNQMPYLDTTHFYLLFKNP